MRYFLFAALLATGFGCSGGNKPNEASFDHAYEAEKGRLAGIERAQNEQAMRDYPRAGIKPDMTRPERERLIQAEILRQAEKSVESINRMGDLVDPKDPQGSSRRLMEEAKKANGGS